MSVKIMAAVWEREDLDASERLVMLALADHADDDGRCYPSIARLHKRTSMTDRGVQKVIARLVEKGFVSIIQNGGRSGANLYIVSPTPEPRSPLNDVHPRTTFTTPPNVVPKTPEPRSPKPSRTIIEPSVIRATLCEVMSEDVADGFIAHRKARRSKLTEHAASLIAKKLRGHPDADAVVLRSIENGWTGIFPESHRSQAPPSAAQVSVAEIFARINAKGAA